MLAVHILWGEETINPELGLSQVMEKTYFPVPTWHEHVVPLIFVYQNALPLGFTSNRRAWNGHDGDGAIVEAELKLVVQRST